MVDKLKSASRHIDTALELLESFAKELRDPRDIARFESLLWKLLEVRFELAIIRNSMTKKPRYARRGIKL